MRFTDRGDGPPDYQVNISTFSLVLGIPLVTRERSLVGDNLIMPELVNSIELGGAHQTAQ